jgi:hypothetical protein
MAARAAGSLSPAVREVVGRSIKAGRFRDFDEFQDFAIRQAASLLLLEEIRKARARRGGKRMTQAEILREVKRVRREVARQYGVA